MCAGWKRLAAPMTPPLARLSAVRCQPALAQKAGAGARPYTIKLRAEADRHLRVAVRGGTVGARDRGRVAAAPTRDAGLLARGGAQPAAEPAHGSGGRARVPNQPFLLELMSRCSGPLMLTSANVSGRPSPLRVVYFAVVLRNKLCLADTRARSHPFNHLDQIKKSRVLCVNTLIASLRYYMFQIKVKCCSVFSYATCNVHFVINQRLGQ